MTLIIQKPTGAKLNLRKTWQPMDPDAATYITAVEAADTAAGQSGGLEERTKIAIDNFVLGCKADGIWSAIKASCILAGARTLEGALVPLVGTAPTNNNFVSGDYNRETGLQGNATNKWLNSNRADNADGQNNAHISVYVSTADTGGSGTIRQYIGGNNVTSSYRHVNRINQFSSLTGISVYVRNGNFANAGNINSTGFMGGSRSVAGSFVARVAGSNVTISQNSLTPNSNQIAVFAGQNTSTSGYTNARLAFYSIGESLDLALLDARVTDLINAFAAAIP